jgi:hypothetical protein
MVNNVVVIATFLSFTRLTAGNTHDGERRRQHGADAAAGPRHDRGRGRDGSRLLAFLRRLPGRLDVRLDLRHPALKKLARLSLWTLRLECGRYGVLTPQSRIPTGWTPAVAWARISVTLEPSAFMTQIEPVPCRSGSPQSPTHCV